MTRRDELLRAAVYRAFACRGTDRYTDALHDVFDAWVLWPWIEHEHALERARLRRVREDAEIAELVELIRSTYPSGVEAVIRPCDRRRDESEGAS